MRHDDYFEAYYPDYETLAEERYARLSSRRHSEYDADAEVTIERFKQCEFVLDGSEFKND